MTTSGMAPLTVTADADLDASTIAATSTVTLRAPVTGAVTRVTYTPAAAITGADTDSRTVELVNTGASGVGTTVVATLSFSAGVNAVALDEKALTLSVVAGATDVAADDVLEFRSKPTGDGLADPGGRVAVDVARD